MPAGWGPRREAATVKAGWLPSYGSQLASLSPRGEKGSRNGRWLVGCTGNYRRFVRLRRTQRNATRPHQTNRVAVLDTGRLADLAARGENPKNSRPDSFPLRSVETKVFRVHVTGLVTTQTAREFWKLKGVDGDRGCGGFT
jgi:hypothetical protein